MAEATPIVTAQTVPDDGPQLTWSQVIAYGAPGIGAGYMYLLLSLYVMKFSTDVLLIAPAVMGTIFFVSRLWDGISDPLAGYLSDRTRSPLGRRRTWLAASLLPIVAAFLMVFAPPQSLTGGALIAWMAVAIIGFYTAMTVFIVPHMSLGAELTTDYHERSRAFGLRHAFFTAGSILALISMQLFINAESQGPAAVRDVAFLLGGLAAVVTGALILFAIIRLNENPDYQDRGARNPFRAYHDVWVNPHARLLIIVTFIENIGSAVIGTLTLYIAQYVVGRYDLAPLMILSYMVPSTLSVPLWIRLSRVFGKVRLWIFSQLLTGVSFGCAIFLPFLPDETSKLVVIFGFAFFAGLSAGCGGTVGPSVQSDVIDYDEYVTGERKEGTYFAAWNFVYKSAAAVMLMLTGFVLQAAGFVPNQEQTMQVKIALVMLYGAFPLTCYMIGAYLFMHFKLDETEHKRIRRALEQRRAAEVELGGASP